MKKPRCYYCIHCSNDKRSPNSHHYVCAIRKVEVMLNDYCQSFTPEIEPR